MNSPLLYDSYVAEMFLKFFPFNYTRKKCNRIEAGVYGYLMLYFILLLKKEPKPSKQTNGCPNKQTNKKKNSRHT